MRVYISGRITGLPDNNKQAFRAAKSHILDLRRYEKFVDTKVVNPVCLGERLDKQWAVIGKKPEWADYMNICIKYMLDSDCVYFLPDWAQSKGASLERHIAKRLGMPCADNMDELKIILGGGTL